MKRYKILFLIGKDRPGIVDDVTTLLYHHQANLEDSRMATLGGCFSIMALFSCESDQLDAIEAGLKTLQDHGFQVSLHEAHDPSRLDRAVALPLKFEVLSMDHPGIVQKVVHILHEYKVNIVSLNTKIINAPYSGAPLFDLIIEADIPDTVSISKVKADISDLAREIDLDLKFL